MWRSLPLKRKKADSDSEGEPTVAARQAAAAAAPAPVPAPAPAPAPAAAAADELCMDSTRQKRGEALWAEADKQIGKTRRKELQLTMVLLKSMCGKLSQPPDEHVTCECGCGRVGEWQKIVLDHAWAALGCYSWSASDASSAGEVATSAQNLDLCDISTISLQRRNELFELLIDCAAKVGYSYKTLNDIISKDKKM